MSAHHTRRTAAFERGLADITAGRRTLLKAGAAGLAVSALAGAAPSAFGVSTAKRCYVLVLDGCRPEELDLGITPTLTGLRDRGAWFPRAQALPVMETIPNHVAMMTGVRAERSGVASNSFYDRTLGEIRDMDRETDIRVTTVIEQLNAAGVTTATVLSKDYLYGVFGSRATYRWEPLLPYNPLTGHQPDAFTMSAALRILNDHDPHFMFVNLGDIDRTGHADLSTIVTGIVTGGDPLPLARQAALAATDSQVKLFTDRLKSSGRWDDSLLIFVADHSMDWSNVFEYINLNRVFAADPLLAGRYVIADNGGADLLYWTGPASQRDAGLARMRELALGTRGVLSVHTPGELGLHVEAADLVVYCKAGRRFSDPEAYANPIPGNHGHPATKPIPFFLSGGHAAAAQRVSSVGVTTMDVAPTVAAFFGIAEPVTGWQGTSRV